MSFVQFLILVLLLEFACVGIANWFVNSTPDVTYTRKVTYSQWDEEPTKSDHANLPHHVAPVYRAILHQECPPWADPTKVGPAGELGPLQITPILLRDVNEYIKNKGIHIVFTLGDRLDNQKSAQMFLYYYHKYTMNNIEDCPEVIARRWNGGPDGDRQDCTLGYWEDVQQIMKDQE